MSDPVSSTADAVSRAERMSALFAHMVVQQANMAMLLLGQAPHPQTGELMKDLEAARVFIDQLEMLEEKTKGNLTAPEQQLLKQSLMTLRLAFVEAVEAPPAPPAGETPPASAAETPPPASEKPATVAEESRKKFSKKY